jgi:LPXTG-motif cell wall-anchored protein
MGRMRRMGGPIALYAVVAALAIAAPLSAQEEPQLPAAPAAPTPAGQAPGAEPAPAPAPPAPGAPAAPAKPAPAPTEPAPAPAAPAPAAPEPAAPAAEAQVLRDEAPTGKQKPRPVAIAAASTGVTISDFQFSPSSVTVNVGDTVTWTNNGPTPHSATSSGGVWDTGIMDAGKSGSHTFTEPGTFAYICTPHPNMHGTVVVQAAASQTGGGEDTGSGGTTSTDSQADGGPSLPSTGMDVGGLFVLGLATLALGAYLRRRTTPEPGRPAGRIGW